MILPAFLVITGFILLIKGADWLVEGASSFAQKLGISQLVIGLTIVSFGTSAPELVVNLIASFRGNADIAIGNIVGSNISNVLLILGVTATITPLFVQQSTVFKEVPFCILASLMLFIMANDAILDGYTISELGRGDGFAFIGFFIIFLYYTFGIRHRDHDDDTEQTQESTQKTSVAGLKILGGLIGLSVGGEFAVRGAIDIAGQLGVSQSLIGLTIVAIGTSLPELTTSVIAALKKLPDISVGNIVGSNIFNIFWILGLSSIIKPLPFQPAINTDLLVVIASTIALFIFMNTSKVTPSFPFWKKQKGHAIARWEGITLLCSYLGYIGYICVRG